MSRAAARKLGGRPEDFVGRTMWDLFPGEIADRQMGSVRDALDQGRNTPVESVKILQGRERWYHTILSPVKGGEEPPGTVLIIG